MRKQIKPIKMRKGTEPIYSVPLKYSEIMNIAKKLYGDNNGRKIQRKFS